MDLLITLAKTMDLVSVQYLLKQIASIPITSYTKQVYLHQYRMLHTIFVKKRFVGKIAKFSSNMAEIEKRVRNTEPSKGLYCNSKTVFLHVNT